MNESQLRGMIIFASKSERAYRQFGDVSNAEQAKAHAERLQSQLKDRFGYTMTEAEIFAPRVFTAEMFQ